jgi:hypothetical protein
MSIEEQRKHLFTGASLVGISYTTALLVFIVAGGLSLIPWYVSALLIIVDALLALSVAMFLYVLMRAAIAPLSLFTQTRESSGTPHSDWNAIYYTHGPGFADDTSKAESAILDELTSYGRGYGGEGQHVEYPTIPDE